MARFFRRAVTTNNKSLSELAIEERPSFSRVSFSKKSLAELCKDQDASDGSTPRTPAGGAWGSCKTPSAAGNCKTPRTPAAACKTPRTPGGERTPRTPGGRFIKRSGSDKTKIHISTSGDATTVTLETTTTGDVKCGATPATAAPEADAMIAKPSLSRAEALGARPGHFARTHAKAVAADVLTIVVPNDGEVSPKSAKTVRVRRQLKPGGAKSPKRAQELKSEREQELEARLALLEAQLAQQRPGGDNDAGRHDRDDAAAAAALETFAEASAPGLVAMVSA